MRYVSPGTLIVPNSLSDLQNTIQSTRLRPLLADNIPSLSARDKSATTTLVVGPSNAVSDAVKRWSGPVLSVGDTLDGADLVVADPASLVLLGHNHAPAGTQAVAVGDVHNCHRTLRRLLDTLSITPGHPAETDPLLVFVGDLVDKGGRPGEELETLRLVRALCKMGQATLVRGNHEQMLVRRYRGISEPTPAGRATLDAIHAAPDGEEIIRWLGSTPLAFRLPGVDGTPVTVGHASATTAAFETGVKATRMAEQACLFGRKVGNVVDGIVVHGHCEVDEVVATATATGFTVNVDTGACLGNALSAAATYVHPNKLVVHTVPTDPEDLEI
jgi:hypothetical protein